MTHLALVPVPPVAHLDGVSQHYGKTVALNNITLDIPARCMVGLIGRMASENQACCRSSPARESLNTVT